MTVEKTKPETFADIASFLEKCIDKVFRLTPSSFGKFTPSHLNDDYLYNKWIGKEKDFADLYMNCDKGIQERFVVYVIGETEHAFYLSCILHRFFLFCWN